MAPEENASEQAAQAPDVATAGATETGTVADKVETTTEVTQEQQVPGDQLPSDGDQVKDGVQEDGGNEAGA